MFLEHSNYEAVKHLSNDSAEKRLIGWAKLTYHTGFLPLHISAPALYELERHVHKKKCVWDWSEGIVMQMLLSPPMYFQGILCNWTLVGFIVTEHWLDFYSHSLLWHIFKTYTVTVHSFMFLRNILMAKNSTSVVGKLLLSAKRVPRSLQQACYFVVRAVLSTRVIGAVVTQR